MLALSHVSTSFPLNPNFKQHTFIRIHRNSRITRLVRSREAHQPTRHRAPASSDLELMTPGIELRTWIRVRRVQRDDLVAHEVVSRRNALGHRVRDDAAGFHQGRGAPDVRRALAAVFLDFKPNGPGSVSHMYEVSYVRPRVLLCLGHPFITPSVRALGHVRNGRTDMAVGPLCPEKLDIGARNDFGVQSSRRRAGLASSGVAAALKIGEGDVLNGSIALYGTRNAWDFGVHVWVSVGLVEDVVFASDEGIVDVAVGCDGGREGEGGCDVLHLGGGGE
jgi:hypothetical protein